MDAYPLQLGATWPGQLAAIRDAVTEDSGLLREDGVPYRVCRDDQSTFKINLIPAFPVAHDEGIVLEFGTHDLYCRKIAHHVLGARYPSGIQDSEWEGQQRTPGNIYLIDSYIRSVPKIRDSEDRFPKEKLLVMIVAESLRFERMATDVLNIARAGDLLSGEKATLALNLGAWKSIYDNWGAASEAIWHKASLEARKPFEPLARTTKKPQWTAPKRIDKPLRELVKLDAQSGHEVLEASRTMRVIQRPVFGGT